MDSKCRAVLDWFSQFEIEYPGFNFPKAPYHLSEVANLYRDKYFVPVFGFSYDASNAEKLRKVDLNVLHHCYGLMKYRKEEYLEKLRPRKQFFDLGFYFNPQLAAMVAERRKVEQWMEEVLAYTEHLEPTKENLRELDETYLRAARRDLAMLWPSEQQMVLARLEERKRILAQALPAAPTVPVPSGPELAKASETQMWFEEGMKFELGHQRAKNLSEAATWYERAASRGHAAAQTQLAYLYQTGAGVAQDSRKAFALYTEAAASRDVLAQFRLAVSYINGIGTTVDPAPARKWLASAGEGGHQQAQLMLGLMLQQGLGGEKNEFAARRWLQKASSGSDRTIAEKARSIQQKIDERVLFSGPFRTEELAALALVGFGLVALMANADSAPVLSDPYDPTKYGSKPFSGHNCAKVPAAVHGACLGLGGY